ncbi:MAG: baseplate J/gp47 family protein [Roseburia sp.]
MQRSKNVVESITDVKVDSPSAGVVDIRFITSDGIPGAALIADVLKNVSAKTERPLTDKVNVDAPETAEFEIELTYYVAESEKNKAAAVKRTSRMRSKRIGCGRRRGSAGILTRRSL